jgi:hypothetical protein
VLPFVNLKYTSRAAVFNLGYAYPEGYEKTAYEVRENILTGYVKLKEKKKYFVIDTE